MRIRLLLIVLLLSCGIVLPMTAAAQSSPRAPTAQSIPSTQSAPSAESADKVLGTLRQQLDGIQKALGTEIPDDRLVALRNAAQALQSRSEGLIGELGPQLANVEAREAELGQAPPTGEGADVAAQRTLLAKQRGLIDAQSKLARLVVVESGQAIERILEMRRARFQARLFERTDTYFSAAFWQELVAGAPRDLGRLRALGAALGDASMATPPLVWGGLLLAAVAVLLIFVRARGALLRFSSTRVPAGRLRRSAFAMVNTLLPTFAGFVIAWLLALGPGWSSPLQPLLLSTLERFVAMTVLATYVASLGYALLSPRRPSWRLPGIPDRYAIRMRRDPLLLGLVIGLGLLFERLAGSVNVSLAGAVAINGLIAVALAVVLVRILLRIRAARWASHGPHPDSDADVAPPSSSPLPWWVPVAIGVAWTMVLASLVLVLIGFVALGGFVVRQLVWFVVVAGTAYLLGALVDDAFMTLLGGGADSGTPGNRREGDPEGRGRLRSQAAVLLSGASHVVIALTALVLILAPFGEGPEELLSRAGGAGAGVAIGEIQIRPGLVIQAMLVLVAGLFFVRVMQRWLAERYLPTTRIDPGMRSSVTTLLGYLGVIAAVSFALSAVGLGLERIAWVASALSVGIGFGLQAVVSNFVSGLILLAERPVKVGDWVSLGGVEGDIRRINVRATEIQMGDRSTVIVPNSEFITKTVRNLTMANPLGVVSIKLPMPLDTDVEKVRALLLAAFAEHPDVLETPSPNVFLDGIDAGNLIFAASGSVSSPRKSYGVKSALLFDILRRVREARLPMGRAPTMVLQAAPAAGGAGGEA